jgi:hypothetical protein
MISRAVDRHIAADINLGGHLVVASHTYRLLKAPGPCENQRRAFNLLIAALAR